MFAKTSSKNQLTLQKGGADAVRTKLADLELKEKDIAVAVAWARKPARKTKK